jgi:hypothetical protein
MVDAEYGNQGLDFKMVPREGFGWMNCAVFVSRAFVPALIIFFCTFSRISSGTHFPYPAYETSGGGVHESRSLLWTYE